MNKFSRAALGATLLVASGLAAAATNVVIDAKLNSLGGGTGLDTGVFLTAGESFSVAAVSTDRWNNSGVDPTYETNANGHAFQSGSLGGLYDAFGALVGQVGGGPLFNVGTSFTGVAATSGELEFFFFDSDAWNNTGAVHAAVSVVPEPMNVALMALALGAFALTRRRQA